jgi:hypothetical protein
MFKLGQAYEFTMWLSAEQGRETFVATVIKIELPLITVDQGGNQVVINTASPHFAKAEPYRR